MQKREVRVLALGWRIIQDFFYFFDLISFTLHKSNNQKIFLFVISLNQLRQGKRGENSSFVFLLLIGEGGLKAQA